MEATPTSTYAGIDWSWGHHALCIIDEHGRRVEEHAPRADCRVIQHQRQRDSLMQVNHVRLEQLRLFEILCRYEHEIEAWLRRVFGDYLEFLILVVVLR